MTEKQKILTILILAVLTLSITPVFLIPAPAIPVPDPDPNDPIVTWAPPDGESVHASLKDDPEWLKVYTVTHVSHTTWIHVLGKDTLGQDIEAKAQIEESTMPQREFPLVDWFAHENDLPNPYVTFAEITEIYQQDGEHCNVFQIHTYPEPKQDWLGTYHATTGYIPEYYGGFPVEPSNPDPLKIILNWDDKNGDGKHTEDECTPPGKNSTITIVGLDQYGEKLVWVVNVPSTAWMVEVNVPGHTWSDVSTITGGASGISYFIFTHPKPQRRILEYKIRVDHIRVTADPKNILADGKSTSEITITLLDKDDHEVHWANEIVPGVPAPPVEINVATTGGKVQPSLDIKIEGCHTYATTTLTSDTNARIVKVSALALVPAILCGDYATPPMELEDNDLVGFDGLNSVGRKRAWWERIVCIGGTGSGRHYVAFITLTEGCNLISIPIIPDNYILWNNLPDAGQYLQSVATYYDHDDDPNTPHEWRFYDWDQDGPDKFNIRHGLAYWVKAKKPCTLVISGRHMDQYTPDPEFGVPPSYKLTAKGWNLVGVTTTQAGISTADYLESLESYGPIWVYRHMNGESQWIRNPKRLFSGEGMWLFSSIIGILAP